MSTQRFGFKSGFRIQNTLFYIFDMSVPWIMSHFLPGTLAFITPSFNEQGWEGGENTCWIPSGWLETVITVPVSLVTLTVRKVAPRARAVHHGNKRLILKAATEPIFYPYLFYFVSAYTYMNVRCILSQIRLFDIRIIVLWEEIQHRDSFAVLSSFITTGDNSLPLFII